VKKLLIIGYVWPEPNSSAAGTRMLQLITLFTSQQWSIVFASAAALSEHRADLNILGVEEKIIALNDSSFNEYVKDLQPQAVLFDRFFIEEQFGWRVEQMCPQTLRILDTEDLHSLRNARYRLLKKSQQTLDKESDRQQVGPVLANPAGLYAHMAADDMAQREIAAIFRCDLTLMISQFEIELLTQYFSVPEKLLHYCPFIIQKNSNEAALKDFLSREHFVAIGNFRHEPNWDAVLYLKHAIWPLIRAKLPSAELHIYGAYPPPKATQLDKAKDGFYIKGWVDDANQVMQQTRVCLAPLRFGAGIKGKLIEAMRNGTPSVTTNIGAEAMCGDLEWCGFIENSATQFAEAAIKLYEEQTQWQKAQTQGMIILQKYFGAYDYGQLFVDRLNELQENLDAERKQNFIGAMLRHHTLKSTQYMSQWIEAKNRKG
jgi:hypothetical protein